MNAGTLLDFFNQLSKTPGPGGFCESIEKVISFELLEFDKQTDSFYTARLIMFVSLFRFLSKRSHYQKKTCGQFKRIDKRKIITI